MSYELIKRHSLLAVLTLAGLVLVPSCAPSANNPSTAASDIAVTALDEVTDLSRRKWSFMADKDVKSLEPLFAEGSRFVHMSGTWGKQTELEIIKSGRIWYKEATVHDIVAERFNDTVVTWSRITLNAVVGELDVTNEFTVTEVYQPTDHGWQLLNMTFSSVRDEHTLERRN